MKITEGNLSDMERGDRPWTPDQITKFIDAISECRVPKHNTHSRSK